VIEIAVTGGSASPLTGESAVIRQTPAWPPLKVVNMRASKLGTGRGTSAGRLAFY